MPEKIVAGSEHYGKCDVCGKAGPVVVRCSSMGPFSFAYCQECLSKGAEPYWFMVSTVAISGLWPDGVSETEQQKVRKVLQYLQRSEEEFKTAVYRAYHGQPF